MNDVKSSLIIDLSGKAGAGKTYLKNKLIQTLSPEYKCIDLSDYVFSVKDFVDFFIYKPFLFFSSVAFVFLFIPKKYKDLSVNLRRWVKMQMKIIKGRALDCDFVFIDEGFFRRVSLLRMRSFRKTSFGNTPALFRKTFFYPNMTIFVTADYDLCENRRMGRDRGTSRYAMPGDKREGLVIMEDLKNDIEFAEKTGIVKILRYHNEEEFNTSLITEIIKARKKRQNKTKESQWQKSP